jgi:thiol-disulfide isomerase/thioredoxin
VNGKEVRLSSFRGKYVLVDFWASWCAPCREENPNVVKAYNKYKDKNFTILGVSLDDQKNQWVDAIEMDGLTWTQVSDLNIGTVWLCRYIILKAFPIMY